MSTKSRRLVIVFFVCIAVVIYLLTFVKIDPRKGSAQSTGTSLEPLRVGLVNGEGVFLVYDAIIPREYPRPRPGYIAYWMSFRDHELFLFDRLLYDAVDIGHALRNSDRDLLVNASRLASIDREVDEYYQEALRENEDRTTWEPATHEGVAELMGFRPSLDPSAPSGVIDIGDAERDCIPPVLFETNPRSTRPAPNRYADSPERIVNTVLAAIPCTCTDNPCCECPGNCCGGSCCEGCCTDGQTCCTSNNCCVGRHCCEADEECCHNGQCCVPGEVCIHTACDGQYCWDGQCCPVDRPDPCSPSLCCETTQDCCYGLDCCDEDQECCPDYGGCCPPNRECCEGGCCPLGEYCRCIFAPDGETCADRLCCPDGLTVACTDGEFPEHCCELDQFCCGDGCCDNDQVCCDDECCPAGQVCCEGSCCGPDEGCVCVEWTANQQFCLDEKCCPNDTEVICPPGCTEDDSECWEGFCCPENSECCEGECCPPFHPCCGDICCTPDQICCEPGLCCNRPSVAGAEPDSLCCEGKCCADNAICCNGTCCLIENCCDGAECCLENEVCCEAACDVPGCSVTLTSATAGPCETVELTLSADCWPDCDSMNITLTPLFPPGFEEIEPWLEVSPPIPPEGILIDCDEENHSQTISIIVHGDAPAGPVPIVVTGTSPYGEVCQNSGIVTVDREYDNINVVYRTFIAPQVISTGSNPVLIDYFKGDNRWFGDNGSSRSAQEGLVTIDPQYETGEVTAPYYHFGSTKGYDNENGSDVTPCAHCAPPYGDWCLLPTATADCLALAINGAGGNVLSIIHERVSTTEVRVRLELVGKNPCVTGAPAIDAYLTVHFRQVCQDADLGPVEFRLYGVYDGFPWHELLINGTGVFQHDPCLTADDPEALFWPIERRHEKVDEEHPPFQDIPLDQWQSVPGLDP